MVQQKFNEAIANEGKSIEILKEKYKEITAYGSVSDKGVNITVRYTVSKDYPVN